MQALGRGTSVVMAHGLWSMLRSCGAFSGRLSCSTACEILVPELGIEPMSSALAGRLLSTAPLRKSSLSQF